MSWDCCSSCLKYCLECCRNCCLPAKGKQRYPHVKYKSPEQANIAVEIPDVLDIPPEKTFAYPQQRSEFPVHPQMRPVIVEQPVALRRGTSESSRRTLSSGDSHGEEGAIEQRAASPEEDGAQPTLHFSLYYDLQRQVLTIHLHKATNLPAKDQRCTSNPFVVAYVEPSKVEICHSKIIYKTLNPTFDEMFEFKNLTPDEVRKQTIVFRIYNHDKYAKSDFIGAVVLPLREADLLGVTVGVIIDEKADTFRSETKGDLLLSLNYVPGQGMLHVLILKATNLQKQGIVGLADPYVNIFLMYEGKRKAKWKTTIKRNTLLPIFNEAFAFDISRINIRDITLEIAIMNYDQFSRNNVMGNVCIGENVEQASGRAHWAQMMSSARTPVSQWHPIMPAALEGQPQ